MVQCPSRVLPPSVHLLGSLLLPSQCTWTDLQQKTSQKMLNFHQLSREIPGTPNNGTPIPILLPYHSHKNRWKYGNGMGMGVPHAWGSLEKSLKLRSTNKNVASEITSWDAPGTWHIWLHKWLFQLDDGPNLYIGNGCLTKHPFWTGCLGFKVCIYVSFNVTFCGLHNPWTKSNMGEENKTVRPSHKSLTIKSNVSWDVYMSFMHFPCLLSEKGVIKLAILEIWSDQTM